MRTNELRRMVRNVLSEYEEIYGLKGIFYHDGNVHEMYPHIVYDFTNMTINGICREDFMLDIDIFVQRENKTIENIADDLCSRMNNLTYPSTNINATFFLESKRYMPDEDTNVRHIQLRFSIQTYER